MTEDWQTATSPREDLTFLVGTHASDATLPWNLVTAKQHDWTGVNAYEGCNKRSNTWTNGSHQLLIKPATVKEIGWTEENNSILDVRHVGSPWQLLNYVTCVLGMSINMWCTLVIH